ncbi:MAG: DJ-1/PfpI family protein [Chitinophagales bacterium]
MKKPTRFIFLVLPEVHLLDLAGPDQTLLEAIGYGANFEILYCGTEVAPTTTAGLQLKQQQHFSKVNVLRGDYVIIPGSNVSYLLSENFRKQESIFEWLRQSYQAGANLMSICAGSFVLALAGILNGRQCTTHFKRTAQLQKMFPQLKVKEDVLFVEEERIFTSAGITAGIDLMLYVIEQLTDSYFAHQVARELVMYIRRDGSSGQESVFLKFRNHIHSGVHQTQDYIIDHIHTKISLAQLAGIAHMSYRNYSRIFRKETGVTPLEYINLVRREKAEQLLLHPDRSRRQVANMVGLESERQLQRLLQK